MKFPFLQFKNLANTYAENDVSNHNEIVKKLHEQIVLNAEKHKLLMNCYSQLAEMEKKLQPN